MDLFSINEATISYSLGKKRNNPTVSTSVDAYKYIIDHWKDIDHVESFYALFLSRSNRVLCYKLISKGGIHGTVADPKIIFQAALLSHASLIVLLHNHPSGNLRPSEDDIRLTKKLASAGEFLDLKILDHIIATSDGYYSFADEGVL